MPMRCNWPGCVRSLEEIRVKEHYFRAPRDTELFKKWKSIVPKGKRDFTPNSSLCHRHFKEEDILRYFREKGPHGKEWVLKRGRVMLKPGSIPIPSVVSTTERVEIKSPPTNLHERISDVKIEKPDEQELVIPLFHIIEFEGENISPVEKKEFSSPIIEGKEPQLNQQSESLEFSFDNLKKRKEKVIENSSWTTTESEEFICYLFWGSNYVIQKQVLIFKDLKVKIILDGREPKVCKNLTLKSFQNLSALLKIVQKTKSFQKDTHSDTYYWTKCV